MAINRLTIVGNGTLELNRVDADNREAQCSLDETDFPNGAEVGTIVAVAKEKGTLKLTGKLFGLLSNSERIANQYTPGLKNYKVEKGEMGSVLFLDKGNTFTTNTICYDTTEFTAESNALSALAAAGTAPLYGIKDATTGVIKITATATNAPFQVVKKTTMPDGQIGVKLIVISEADV